jgi:hypothetical protein
MFVSGPHSESTYLRQFHSRVQPRTIASKEYLRGPGSLDSLFEKIESSNAGCVGKNIRMPDEVIDQCELSFPFIAETTEMRNYKVDVRVFFSQ